MKTIRLLFSDAMARAVVSGRKTVVRRPVVCPGWSPAGPEYDGQVTMLTNSDPAIGTQAYFRTHESEWHGVRPPCLPGDLLIGRECWAPNDGHDPFYRATDGEVGWRPLSGWRPSIHMPDRAARIRRRVVSVTVERLQDITPAECDAEGFDGAGAFIAAWDRMYAAKGLGWAVNPWVWPIEFGVDHAP